MENNNQIPFWTAILINLNVIIGSAFFLGAGEITQRSGFFAPLTWLIMGLIIFPIVLSMAELSKIYPLAGGLYVYSKEELGPLWGFISGWGYFIGTVVGNAIIIHKFAALFLGLFSSEIIKSDFNVLIFDIILISTFTLFNLANVNFFEKAQIIFTTLKTIPLLAVIIASFFLFKFTNISSAPLNFSGLFESIPLVLFAYMGFEVCCTITHKIKGGEKNAARAILFSFGLIIGIYALLQFCILGIHGTNTIMPFLEIMPKLTSNMVISNIGNFVINFCILSSLLSAFYGLFYGNNWVLYALAEEKTLPYSPQLIKLNKFQTPWVCVVIQGLLTIFFLLITQKAFDLITMSDFALIISYFLSVLAFMAISLKTKISSKIFLGVLALLSCIYFLYMCAKELLESGIFYLIPFIIILAFGVILYKFEKR